jgi:glycosyltransferase involved in cell wall biosynthesis
MSVFNGGPSLSRAIESILNQTFKNFEFIIINDGSTDESLQIIKSYADADPRIVVLNQSNHGLIYSLNRGIRHARADLIARIDADDSSHPQRFEKQVAALRAFPEVSVIGSSFSLVDQNDHTIRTFVPPSDDIDIRRQLFSRNPLCHGSVMMRKDTIESVGLYHASAVVAEDYDLWVRVASAGGTFMSIPESLYRWQHNPDGISWNNNDKQAKQVARLREGLWQKLDFPSESSWNLIRRVWRIRLKQPIFAGQSARQLALDQYRLTKLLIQHGRIGSSVRLGLVYLCMFPFNALSISEQALLKLERYLARTRHWLSQSLRSLGLKR